MPAESKNNPQARAGQNLPNIGMAIGLVVGAGIGMVYGFAIDNFTLGLVLGAGGGLVLGLAIGAAAANRREE